MRDPEAVESRTSNRTVIVEKVSVLMEVKFHCPKIRAVVVIVDFVVQVETDI